MSSLSPIVLGLDPSLTNFGWGIHDPNKPFGDPLRCIDRGRFQTSSKTLFIGRYVDIRTKLFDLLQEKQIQKIGLEYPVFDNLYSEGMYGLFLYTCEALYDYGADVVFFSPGQIKAHARILLKRPKILGHQWKMEKPDMVEAAKLDTGSKANWNHNEADAYLVARLASRFWQFHGGFITEADLSPLELKQFTEVKQYVRGKKAGSTVKRGILYRENERFFQWSDVKKE